MKKLLGLLAATGMVASTGVTVVACNTGKNDSSNIDNMGLEELIKEYTNLTISFKNYQEKYSSEIDVNNAKSEDFQNNNNYQMFAITYFDLVVLNYKICKLEYENFGEIKTIPENERLLTEKEVVDELKRFDFEQNELAELDTFNGNTKSKYEELIKKYS